MIDWKLLGKAVQYFEDKGFKYIEVPWLVSLESIRATLPEEVVKDPWNCPPGYFVGSGEQGFVEMLPLKGRLFTVTPCFRSEPHIDALHQYWFMKLELWSDTTTREELSELMSMAGWFWFDTYRELAGSVERVWTGDMSADLYIHGIEVGSYGLRETPKQNFLYGTGLALPRFSVALTNWKTNDGMP